MVVRRSRLRKVILYLALMGVAVLALYLLDWLDLGLVLKDSLMRSPTAQPQADHVLTITEIVLWMMLAIVVMRALNELIFGLGWKARRGYEAPSLVRNIFSIIAYIISFVIIFKYFYPAVDIGALFTTSAIFGVIIGLALQETLGNLFAGISLQADKPFQVGDVITVGQWTGIVEEITWRGIKLRTFTNRIVLISNSSAAKEAIEVAPRDNLNARLVFFNTLYTDSPAKAIHVVREAVREADNVSQRMTPIVRIKNLGADGVDYEVKYWLEDYAKYNDTDALVRQRIWYAFRRAGLSFAFPTRTLYVERPSKMDGAHGAVQGLVERLAAVDIFAPLTEEEIKQLAHASMRHVFAPGETVIRAGEEGGEHVRRPQRSRAGADYGQRQTAHRGRSERRRLLRRDGPVYGRAAHGQRRRRRRNRSARNRPPGDEASLRHQSGFGRSPEPHHRRAPHGTGGQAGGRRASCGRIRRSD